MHCIQSCHHHKYRSRFHSTEYLLGTSYLWQKANLQEREQDCCNNLCPLSLAFCCFNLLSSSLLLSFSAFNSWLILPLLLSFLLNAVPSRSCFVFSLASSSSFSPSPQSLQVTEHSSTLEQHNTIQWLFAYCWKDLDYSQDICVMSWVNKRSWGSTTGTATHKCLWLTHRLSRVKWPSCIAGNW